MIPETNAIRDAVAASMNDIGLGTEERLNRATARIQAAVLKSREAVSDDPRD